MAIAISLGLKISFEKITFKEPGNFFLAVSAENSLDQIKHRTESTENANPTFNSFCPVIPFDPNSDFERDFMLVEIFQVIAGAQAQTPNGNVTPTLSRGASFSSLTGQALTRGASFSMKNRASMTVGKGVNLLDKGTASTLSSTKLPLESIASKLSKTISKFPFELNKNGDNLICSGTLCVQIVAQYPETRHLKTKLEDPFFLKSNFCIDPSDEKTISYTPTCLPHVSEINIDVHSGIGFKIKGVERLSIKVSHPIFGTATSKSFVEVSKNPLFLTSLILNNPIVPLNVKSVTSKTVSTDLNEIPNSTITSISKMPSLAFKNVVMPPDPESIPSWADSDVPINLEIFQVNDQGKQLNTVYEGNISLSNKIGFHQYYMELELQSLETRSHSSNQLAPIVEEDDIPKLIITVNFTPHFQFYKRVLENVKVARVEITLMKLRQVFVPVFFVFSTTSFLPDVVQKRARRSGYSVPLYQGELSKNEFDTRCHLTHLNATKDFARMTEKINLHIREEDLQGSLLMEMYSSSCELLGYCIMTFKELSVTRTSVLYFPALTELQPAIEPDVPLTNDNVPELTIAVKTLLHADLKSEVDTLYLKDKAVRKEERDKIEAIIQAQKKAEAEEAAETARIESERLETERRERAIDDRKQKEHRSVYKMRHIKSTDDDNQSILSDISVPEILLTVEEKEEMDNAASKIRSVLAALDRVRIIGSKRGEQVQAVSNLASQVVALNSSRTWTAPSGQTNLEPLNIPLSTKGAFTNPSTPQNNPGPSLLRDEVIASLSNRLELLTSELVSKQDLFAQYMTEADDRMSELQTLGIEIVELRKQVIDLTSRNELLRKTLDEYRARELQLMEDVKRDASTDHMTELELRGLVRRVVASYTGERSKRKVLEEKLAELNRLEQVESQFKKMVKAHQAQAAFIQKLQEENGKLDKFKSTIKNQELVITKLESLLADKLKPAPPTLTRELSKVKSLHNTPRSRGTPTPRGLKPISRASSSAPNEQNTIDDDDQSDEVDKPVSEQVLEAQIAELKKELAVAEEMSGSNLRFELERCKARIEELQDENAGLQRRLDNLSGGGDDDEDSGDASERAKTAETRCEALEQELAETAKRAANTVSQLKMKLLRKEMLCKVNNIVDDEES